MRKRSVILSAIIVLALQACVIVPGEVRQEIKGNCDVGTANVNDWCNLTDQQRLQAYWKLTRAMHDLNFSINDEAVPPAFVTDPWAPVASVTSTAPVASEAH